MSAIVISGRELAPKLRAELRQRVDRLKAERGVTPGLAVVLVGDDAASQVYVANKDKACTEVGITSKIVRMSADSTQQQVVEVVRELNADPTFHGVMVQLPLPAHLDSTAILDCIDPDKDVDGLHPMSLGRLVSGREGFESCTPRGIIYMLKSAGIELSGKRAVVLGRSNIVGKPVSLLLLRENATVTVCHSKTADLPSVCREADILVVAIGRANFVTADFVKPGAAVIDVGVNRLESGLTGDVAFDEVSQVAGYITPVPGGVGLMTVTMLMENTVISAERRV